MYYHVLFYNIICILCRLLHQFYFYGTQLLVWILYFVLKVAFLNWFKHASFKWILLVTLIIATFIEILWAYLGRHVA